LPVDLLLQAHDLFAFLHSGVTGGGLDLRLLPAQSSAVFVTSSVAGRRENQSWRDRRRAA
jgi:hypothetical protein